MPGGTIKKESQKKKGNPPKADQSKTGKTATKAATKPTIVKARKKTVAKKTVKKVPQKINLKIRTIKEKEVKKEIDTHKAEQPKHGKAGKRKIVVATVKKPAKAAKPKPRMKKTPKPTPRLEIKREDINIKQGRVITERTESSKIFLMWSGVSFFMILIVIFWGYNTVNNIQKAQLDFQPSERSLALKQMTAELSSKMGEIKSDIESIKSFASSSIESQAGDNNRESIFQATATTSNQVTDELIQNLKRNLEIKSGLSEPLDSEYYFLIDTEDEKKLLAGLEVIEINDSLEDVEEALGEPSFEQELLDNRGAFVIKKLSYYIKIYQEDLVNLKYDKYISLEFDETDKLLKIDKFID